VSGARRWRIVRTMKWILVLVSVLVSVEVLAQPAGPGGQAPVQPQPVPVPPPPAPYAPPPYYPPPPMYYGVPELLTLEERRILEQGEISTGRVVGGVLMSMWLGLGVGQAIEGRWSNTGWIFTFGEPTALGMIVVGLLRACDQHDCDESRSGLAVAGILGYMGLRLWGMVDVFVGPAFHNQKVRALRARTGNQGGYGVMPFVVPASEGRGATAGLTLRF
jgi:hypothetical protein